MRLIRYALTLCPVLLLMAAINPPLTEKNSKTSSLFKAQLPGVLPAWLNSSAYTDWKLSKTGLSKAAFEEAVKGYTYLVETNQVIKPGVLTIIDYSKPSSQKRLFILDMKNGGLLLNTWVAHGRNSGRVYARDFSNESESHKSSLGFYITRGTYTGINGYSLKLAGCEQGINDHAAERAIVIHGAEYVSEAVIRSRGCLGRSFGCPAVPVAVHKKLIDQIKNGSCVYLYHPAKKYHLRSKILDS